MEEANTYLFLEIIDSATRTIRSVLVRHFSDLPLQDREDIEQEIRIKVWKLLASGKSVEHLTLYIRRMVYSIAVDYIRTARRKKPRMKFKKDEEAVVFMTRAPESDSPEYRIRYKEIKNEVEQAIDSLMENRKKVIKLHILGMNIEEIAYFLQWSTNKVRHLLYRGLEDLRARLKEKGMELDL